MSKYWYNIAPIHLEQCQAILSPRPIPLQKHGFRNRGHLPETIYTRIHPIGVGLKPDKRRTNITSKYLLNNLTLIMLIFYTARGPVVIQ